MAAAHSADPKSHETLGIGYFSIRMSAVHAQGSPESLRSSTPSQVPCILLARLAVDRECSRQDLI